MLKLGDDVTLYRGDCLEIMPTLEAESVDAIITDLPYGTTACAWDSIIPIAPMWEQVKRILKPGGVFVTTASQPFTSVLVVSNLEWFRYEWIYKKRRITGFLNANRRPMSAHENVLVFADGEPDYFPQFEHGEYHKRNREPQHNQNTDVYSGFNSTGVVWTNEFYPIGVIEFGHDKDVTVTRKQRPSKLERHPTQKPLGLYRYLMRTYTCADDVVLDLCFGSGTTGVAAVQLGRKFIGIEIDAGYFEIAERRISEALAQPSFLRLTSLTVDVTKQGISEQLPLDAARLMCDG